MPLEVHGVVSTDLPRLIQLEVLAHAHSPAAQYLRGRSCFSPLHWLRAYMRYDNMLSGMGPNPHTYFRKIIDTERVDLPAYVPPQFRHIAFMRGQPDPNGEVIGWLRYEIVEDGIDLDTPYDDRWWDYPWGVWPPGMAQVVVNYWAGMEEMRRRFIGDLPHNYLCLLVVNPQHRRRGAAAALLEDFCAEVDNYGLPSYCEASPMSHGLCFRYGFEYKGYTSFSLQQYGIPDQREHYNMVRRPTVMPRLHNDVEPDEAALDDSGVPFTPRRDVHTLNVEQGRVRGVPQWREGQRFEGGWYHCAPA